MLFLLASVLLAGQACCLNLSIALSGGNVTTSMLYGLFYEDIYHSGDGGMYAELIRNRAFQGSSSNGTASTNRTMDYWHPVGGVSLRVDMSQPTVSSALMYQMRMDVPTGTTGDVGFYNEGFWGFGVDSAKNYTVSFYMRGTYNGVATCYFRGNTTGQIIGTTGVMVSQKASDGWKKTSSDTFMPNTSAENANNTFYFMFDGSQLAGQSVYFNLLSVFKQTFGDRNNGLREDLSDALFAMDNKYLRMPGGNNMEGNAAPYRWKWNETIGDLTTRPGRPGTWGDVNTDGLGLLEQMQWCLDMNLTTVLGVWAGLYLDGEVIPEASLQPYVDDVMNELEFLMGSSSTKYGTKRAALGYPAPFTIKYVEVGNEDYLNNGTSSYQSYRFASFYNAIHAEYPDITIISTLQPGTPQSQLPNMAIDIHVYNNTDGFVNQFNQFDNYNRSVPVFVAEYAAIYLGNATSNQIGAQSLLSACSEAVYLLGCERNSDVVIGTSYGALIKSYNEAPDTVAVIKHTADDILLTMSYYVQKLFANYAGFVTLPVIATDGGLGPVYWSATKSTDNCTILKMVNFDGRTGTANTVSVSVNASTKTTAKLITLTAPSESSVNNLPELGGETSIVSETILTRQGDDTFKVVFSNPYEIVVLVV